MVVEASIHFCSCRNTQPDEEGLGGLELEFGSLVFVCKEAQRCSGARNKSWSVFIEGLTK